jgi:capsule polysaccharide export protein KpsE/RkpR
VGGLLTLLISWLIPNRYESSTRLMSPDMKASASEALMAGLLGRTSGGGGGGGGLVGLGANLLGGLDNTGAMFIGVLNSRSVADSLVKRFDLKKVYRDRWDKDAREDLADRTNITQDRKSEIITISVQDRDPARAATLATAYVDELNRLLAQVNTSSAHRERVFIEERLKVVRQELDTASKQLADFSTKTTTLDLKEQGKAMVGAVATLQGELIAYETQLSGLQQIYTANNVRVRSLQARVNELRHQLEQVRGSGVEPQPGAAEGDEAYPSFRRLPALGVTYADLYREVKIREAVFETLTQQYEMAKISEAKEIPSVKVLDPANLPEKKSSPHRLLITVLGVIASFAFGAVFVIGRATWKQVDPDDPRKMFAAEVWGDTRPARAEFKDRAQKIRIKLRRNSDSDSNSNSDFKVGDD